MRTAGAFARACDRFCFAVLCVPFIPVDAQFRVAPADDAAGWAADTERLLRVHCMPSPAIFAAGGVTFGVSSLDAVGAIVGDSVALCVACHVTSRVWSRAPVARASGCQRASFSP